MARLRALLSDEERARAARFLAPLHGDRFTVAHGRLREFLAHRLGVSPDSLQFASGQYGKPHLSGHLAQSGLQFNLSHSGGLGLLGWAEGKEIGVDIELWRPLSDEAALVRRFFSQAENLAYAALSPAERTQGFFECWTRKEAYIKAVGRGLGLPLDSFDVAFGPGRKAAILRASAELPNEPKWSLAAPKLEGGASAAIILEGDNCHVLPAD